jgi:hypothetical protein
MKADTSSFVAPEYRPAGIILQDPRNMHLDDIRKVLKHCFGRQAESGAKSGAKSAFQFLLYIGPKRKSLFAEYPDPSNKEQNRHKKKKGKGKQEVDQLQGLHQINKLEEPLTATEEQNNHPGPFNIRGQNISEPTASDRNGLVRIDMGQMLKLKDMGQEARGPVNGPNEGYPEYEVPTAVFALLKQAPNWNNADVAGQKDQGPGSETHAIDPQLVDYAERSIQPIMPPKDTVESGIARPSRPTPRLRAGAILTTPVLLLLAKQTQASGSGA